MSALTPESPSPRRCFRRPITASARTAGAPRMLILHYTGMPDEGEALQWLCNPVSQVSAHYFVFGDGRVLQMVPEARRAWHAGRSSWDGETDINSCSIGIEIANPGHPGGLPPFPDAQIESVAALAKDIVTRWRIPGNAGARPIPMSLPAARSIRASSFPGSVCTRPASAIGSPPPQRATGASSPAATRACPIEALQAMLVMYGYGLKINGVFDEDTEKVVAAFQRHFRPERVDGVADASTITTLRNLIAARPAGRRMTKS